MRARTAWKDLGAAAALALGLAGCFVKPDPPHGNAPADARPADGRADAMIDGRAGPGPTVRKIASAYYSSIEHSPGMSITQYSIPTSGITNGELVLFIANIDNGSNTVWPLPTTAFHQIAQAKFGGDGQTYFAAWTIASGEPPLYEKPYGTGIMSADATITLLAIDGADPAGPVSMASVGATGESPVSLASPGVTTTAPNSLVIFAGGADWFAQDSTATFTQPSGFTVLDAFSDRGGLTFEWTTQLVASAVQAAAGPSGPHTGTIETTPGRVGEHWTLEMAFAPAP